MKTNKLIALVVTAVVMTCTTAEAQRSSGRDNSNSARTESRSNGGNVRSGGGGGVRNSSTTQPRQSQSVSRPQQNVRPQSNPSQPQSGFRNAQRPSQPTRSNVSRPSAPLQSENKRVALPNSPADNRKPGIPRLGPTPAHRNEGSFRLRQEPRPHDFTKLHPAHPMGNPHIVNGHKYFREIPPAAHRFDHHGNRFYVNCGNFYKWHATLGYELVARPLGMLFSMLPFACVKVYVNSTPYWYGDGVWFSKQNNGYVIINRPLAATAEVFLPTLPFSCKKVIIDGTTYYSGENNLFLPVKGGYILVDNADNYDIVEEDGNINLTNFVSELPYGSKRVIVNGKLYWFGGETWFEPVNGGYVVVDEPYK